MEVIRVDRLPKNGQNSSFFSLLVLINSQTRSQRRLRDANIGQGGGD